MDEMVSSEILVIVGITTNAKSNEALSRFNPEFISKFLIRKGARTTIPKNPITTDGIDAIISIKPLRTSLNLPLASSAIYMAVARLIGIAISEAKRVIEIDAIIKGNIPSLTLSLAGYHSFPKIKSKAPTSLKRGMPSFIKKNIIAKRIKRDVMLIIKKAFSIK